MCQLSPVTFHGDTIFCINYQNQPYTPAKPIVENIGLAWQSQCQKLNMNRERWGITNIVIPTSSGSQQMLCLPVRKLPAYLASINPKKVRPELRAKIELYQAESDDALWNYWMNGRPERAMPATRAATPSRSSAYISAMCISSTVIRGSEENIHKISMVGEKLHFWADPPGKV